MPPATAMQSPQDLPVEIIKALPGALGAIVALRWIEGSPLQRVASVLGGGSAAYYGAEHAANAMGVSAGFAGFLLGLFGMALASKLFEAIAAFKPGNAIDRLLARWGL